MCRRPMRAKHNATGPYSQVSGRRSTGLGFDQASIAKRVPNQAMNRQKPSTSA